jgi:transcription-repair coupling factor (superfamily II helicase)
MKDLEIRGAGNLLGGEQSGHIAGVGFDLYLRLVGEAVTNFRGDTEEAAPAEVKIELPINAHMPHEYVSSERLRLAAYREIAQATSAEALDEIREELVDRYGAIPEPTENLFQVALLRLKAREVAVREIQLMGPKVRVFPVNGLPESRKMRLERMYPGALYKQIPGTEDWQILLPRPKTARVGGKDLVDREIIDWAESFIDLILAEKAPVQQ